MVSFKTRPDEVKYKSCLFEINFSIQSGRHHLFFAPSGVVLRIHFGADKKI